MHESSFRISPTHRLEWIRRREKRLRLEDGFLRAGVAGAYLPRVRVYVPHLPQERLSHSVPQCVAMALRSQGRDADAEALADLLRTDEDSGTPGERLEWLRPWGYRVSFPQELQFFRDGTLELNHRLQTGPVRLVYRWEEPWLRWVAEALEQGLPPILFVDLGRLCPAWRGLGQAHGVVLAGGDGRQAWIHDPARRDGPVRVGLSTLMDALLPGEPLGAVVSPGSRVPSPESPRTSRAGKTP